MLNPDKKQFYWAVIFSLINACMLAAMGLFGKMLAQYFQPVEVTYFRNLFSLLALTGWIIYSNKINILKTKRPLGHIFRGTIGTIGIVSGMWAVSLMPLAETTILLFTSPLFVVLLSYPVLKEPVGVYRLSAALIGFIGVFVALAPSSHANHLPLLGIVAGLGWGFFAGCVDICLRWIGRTENPMTTTYYFLLLGTFATSLHWPFAELKHDSFSWESLTIMAVLGLSGLLSQLSKSQSLRLSEAATIAPIMYTMIIWTMLFDYIFWDKIPGWNMIAGTIVIISSNLFILYRETHIHSKKKQDPPPSCIAP